MSLVKVRKIEEGDIPFITNSSYESIKEGMEQAGGGITLNTRNYRSSMKALHQYWLSQCEIRILCDKEVPDMILGYCVLQEVEPGRVGVWHTYVKQAYRRQGMAKLLLRPTEDYDKVTVYFPTQSLFKVKNRKHSITPETQELLDKLELSTAYEFIGQVREDRGIKL